MSRKGMTLQEFNDFMKRCYYKNKVRYVTPTIHPRAKLITSIAIDTDEDTFLFNVTNNPDEFFNLNKEANEFLDTL